MRADDPTEVPWIVLKWRGEELEVPLDTGHAARDLGTSLGLELVHAAAALLTARDLLQAAAAQLDSASLQGRALFEARDATGRLERAIAQSRSLTSRSRHGRPS